MNNQPLISVIIPVYNAEKYLEKCIMSVIGQTHKNLEILLINDGSKDNSLDICNKFARLDKRIKVISQNNQGPSAARNKGLDMALGRYIAFVDSDDSIEMNTYEILLNRMLESNAQISIIGMQYCYKKGNQKLFLAQGDSCVLKKKEMLEVFFEDNIMAFSPVNKLYARDLIGTTRFDTQLRMSEDQKFVYQLLKKVELISYDSTICYNINCSDNSLSRSMPTKYHLAMIDVNEYILSDLQNEVIKEKAILYNVDLCLSYFVVYYHNSQFEKADIERIDGIIHGNKKLVLKKGKSTTKIKLILYLISPRLLRYVLLNKRKGNK